MQGPYTLYVGTPGGEVELDTYRNAVEALRARDRLHRQVGSRIRPHWVVGDDTDPPESGRIEWCNGCGDEACLASKDICDYCESEEAEVYEGLRRRRADAV